MAVPTTFSIPDPANYGAASVYDLLKAASDGLAGIDQRLIRAIVDRGEEAVPDLLKFGLEDHLEDPLDLQEDITAIFFHMKTPKALPFYLECIRREPTDVSDELIEALVTIGNEALEPLLALYEELGEEEGSDIAFVLSSLRIRDPRILKLLIERLEYDAGDAAFCLGLYGDPAAKPELEKVLAEIPEEDVELRREFHYAMEQLDAPPGESRPEPFDLWSLYPEKAPPQFELLGDAEKLSLLSHSSAELRAETAASYRNREVPDTVKNRLFELAKTDPADAVRARCWEALAEFAEEPPIRKAMMTVLSNESGAMEERCGALIGLSNLVNKSPEIERRMKEFYDLPAWRARALEAMWRSFEKRFAKYFPQHLDDEDQEIQRQAIWGVGYLAIKTEAAKLRTFFHDEELRADSLFAYALCVPAEITRGRVKALLRRIDEEAEGLSRGETELVQLALDERLAFNGMEPVFADELGGDDDEDDAEEAPAPATAAAPAADAKPGRNDLCPCGSGKKYKKCHGGA